jgi:hypothetical protein
LEISPNEQEEQPIKKSQPKIVPQLPPWLKLIDPEEMRAFEEAQKAMILQKQQASVGKIKIPVKLKIN